LQYVVIKSNANSHSGIKISYGVLSSLALKRGVKNMNDLLKEEVESQEVPNQLILNLIDWMRKKGLDDKDIIDCLVYICSEK
jgi:hypothetical protein